MVKRKDKTMTDRPAIPLRSILSGDVSTLISRSIYGTCESDVLNSIPESEKYRNEDYTVCGYCGEPIEHHNDEIFYPHVTPEGV